MFVDTPSGRLSNSFPGSDPTLRQTSPNSHGIISFDDPHPLTSIKSYRSKNRGEGAPAIPTYPSMACTPQISAKYALFPVVDPYSLQQLAASPSHTSLILKELHFDGGGTPSSRSSTFRRSNRSLPGSVERRSRPGRDVRTFRRSDVFSAPALPAATGAIIRGET